MYIFELIIPGTWLDYEDRQWCWKIENLLRHLESQFFEANTALNLFSSHSATSSESQWESDMERRWEIREQIERKLGSGWEQRELVYSEAEKVFKRERWANGSLPGEFERHKPFIFARAFLYALDGFDKFLGVLAKEHGAPLELTELSAGVASAFPHLKKVRNTAQHLEDRARGLGAGHKPKPLNLQPVVNEAVCAPAGGVLILNSLNGTKYGCTMADGHYGEVDVSPESMQKLQAIINGVFASFKWRGSARHCPS